MTIFIRKGDKEYTAIPKRELEEETNLQEFIYTHPDSIPINEISDTENLVIAAREFRRTDLIGIDGDGEIYLIETKRYVNSDKRRVVAQVLDYGSILWTEYRNDPAKLEVDIDKHVKETQELHNSQNKSLRDRLKDDFGLDDSKVTDLIDKVKEKVKNGDFTYFVVVTNQLGSNLEDLIIFLQKTIELKIYAVAMEHYKDKDYEIMIPRIFGKEVSKVTGITTQKSKEDFEKAVENNLDQKTRDAIGKLIYFTKEMKTTDWSVEEWDYYGGRGKSPIFIGLLPKIKEGRGLYDIQADSGDIHIKYWALKDENRTELINQFLVKCKEKQLDFITNGSYEGSRIKSGFMIKKKNGFPKLMISFWF